MTVDELLVYGKSKIHKDHAKLLLANILEKNPLELLLYLNEEVDVEKENLYKKEVEALKNNKPIQYVLGNVNFYGNLFIVNENVLIPRFETEELVEKTILRIKKLFPNKRIKILDIGCGSGVIGITLKKHIPESDVTLLDISKEALEVAKKNAKALNVEVNFIESDVFEKVQDRYDVIISNPPYIMDKEEIEDIVKENEPHIALYAGADGLDCYKKIMKDINKHLNEEYLIAFEIGRFQAPSIINMTNYFLGHQHIETEKDLQGRDRMIFITKTEYKK
ncbi:MAG: peptide chain release factor N(5)-glutamine methyltransferase [Bacilli bacterium]|nr:peptide chain release factor N(5)-glutamine methyltransferase [Bacilli bacterium]